MSWIVQTEEFRKRVQQRKGGDPTSSTVRGNDHFEIPRGRSATVTSIAPPRVNVCVVSLKIIICSFTN